ncbi:MAG: TonB-dependent receptor, partial [Odoribacter sp.]|nr:TonB-dependent receptor [Odoribacter sp.]
VFRKGSYYKADGKHTNLNADAGLSYSLSFGRHMIFTNVQLNISDNVYSTTGMQAEGFASDHMNDISFAVQYAKDARPTGTEGISRSCGGILSANYSFDERYLLDVNYRFSGSSETGADNRWGHFWSVGGGWNVHNESFMESLEWMNRFKLRASVGYTGSQGFSSYDAIPTFIYYQSSSYAGAVGSYVKGLANSALRWQEKYDINAGVDLNLLRNRLTARFDYYIGTTKGMITNVTVPYTTGFSTYVANLGEVENKGWEAYLNYKVYDNKRDYINVYAGMANNKNTLKKISNSLRAWNDARDKDAMSDPNDAGNREKIITPSVKYYEGCSMSAIWAVRSLGIDPQNGKEIFLKKDGTVTYEYDVADQIVCGDAQPKFNGNVGFNGEIKCFGFSATANYRFGGEYYNQTLVDKVENALVQYNVDRRVLTGRWQKEGDMARFKAVTDRTLTQPTSRFVEKYNLFTLSSLSLYYDFRECNFVKNSFLERLKITAYTNDLFVISSVKTERGTSYPFARTFSF